VACRAEEKRKHASTSICRFRNRKDLANIIQIRKIVESTADLLENGATHLMFGRGL
jgi:hypothetical protein